MRSVIGAISLDVGGTPPWLSPGDDNGTADQRFRRRGRLLPWSGRGAPFRTPGKEGQASSVIRPRGRSSKKARSVVALSRVARGDRAAPVRLRLPVAGARKQVLP